MGINGVQDGVPVAKLPAQKTKKEKIKELGRLIAEHCSLFETMKGHGLEIPKPKIEFIKKKLEEFYKLNEKNIQFKEAIQTSFERASYGAVVGGVQWSVKGLNIYKQNPNKILESNKRHFKMMKSHLKKDFPLLKNSKEAYQELEDWLKKDESKVLLLGTKHGDSSSAGFMSKDFLKKLKELDCILAVEIDHDFVNPKNGKTTEEEFIKYNKSFGRDDIPLRLFTMSNQYPMIHRLYEAHRQGIEIYPVDSGKTVLKSKKWNSKTNKYELQITRDQVMSEKILKLVKENPGKKIVFLGGMAHCMSKGAGTVVVDADLSPYNESKVLGTRLEETLGDDAVLNVLVADEVAALRGTRIDFKDFAHEFPDKFRFSSVALEPEDPNVKKWLESLPQAKSKFLEPSECYRRVGKDQATFLPVYRTNGEGKSLPLFDMLLIPRE